MCLFSYIFMLYKNFFSLSLSSFTYFYIYIIFFFLVKHFVRFDYFYFLFYFYLFFRGWLVTFGSNCTNNIEMRIIDLYIYYRVFLFKFDKNIKRKKKL